MVVEVWSCDGEVEVVVLPSRVDPSVLPSAFKYQSGPTDTSEAYCVLVVFDSQPPDLVNRTVSSE